mmetsp:Transcript_5979/g.11521  ORF Transcript_5979/g.11521 Transcript_5979/m.11521 type:complete len:87 (-) Transcript_5979:4-264(-)
MAEGIVPAAASTVASLGGLVVFRESMIRREQKEAEVRQDMIKQSATKKRKHERVKRRDGRMLGNIIGGVSFASSLLIPNNDTKYVE